MPDTRCTTCSFIINEPQRDNTKFVKINIPPITIDTTTIVYLRFLLADID